VSKEANSSTYDLNLSVFFGDDCLVVRFYWDKKQQK